MTCTLPLLPASKLTRGSTRIYLCKVAQYCAAGPCFRAEFPGWRGGWTNAPFDSRPCCRPAEAPPFPAGQVRDPQTVLPRMNVKCNSVYGIPLGAVIRDVPRCYTYLRTSLGILGALVAVFSLVPLSLFFPRAIACVTLASPLYIIYPQNEPHRRCSQAVGHCRATARHGRPIP